MRAVKLGRVASLARTTLDPAAFANEEFEYYSIPAFQDGARPTVTRGSEIRSIKLVVESDMVLFGKLNPDVPKVWRVQPANGRRQIASTEFFALKPDVEALDKDYLYFLCGSRHVLPKAIGMGRGSTPSRQRVDPQGFQEIMIPLPPLEEQRHIARILSTILGATAASKSVFSATAILKRAAENQTFGELNAPLVRLGDLLIQRQYGMSVRGSSNGKWPILRMTNIANGSVHFEGLQFVDVSDSAARPYILADGDILFNRTNSPALVGRTGIVHNPSTAVFASYLIRLRTDAKRLLPQYLNRYLNWEPVQQQIRAMATRGVSQANVSASKLAELEVPLPPIDQQTRLAAVIEAIQGKASAEHLYAGRVAACFQSALDRLLGA